MTLKKMMNSYKHLCVYVCDVIRAERYYSKGNKKTITMLIIRMAECNYFYCFLAETCMLTYRGLSLARSTLNRIVSIIKLYLEQ